MSATEKEILALLLRTREKLRVIEITARLKRSERAIRGRLRSLHGMGLVRRELVITEKGKRAYRYFALQTHELIRSVKKEIRRRLSSLERRIERSKA